MFAACHVIWTNGKPYGFPKNTLRHVCLLLPSALLKEHHLAQNANLKELTFLVPTTKARNDLACVVYSCANRVKTMLLTMHFN